MNFLVNPIYIKTISLHLEEEGSMKLDSDFQKKGDCIWAPLKWGQSSGWQRNTKTWVQISILWNLRPSLAAQSVKNLSAMEETCVWPLGWEDPLEKEMATHSSILGWEIPWTEEPGGQQSMGSQSWTRPSNSHFPTITNNFLVCTKCLRTSPCRQPHKNKQP